MESTKKEINLAAKISLGYAMIATIITIIYRFIELNSYRSFALDIPDRFIFEIIIDFLILVSAALTYMRKRVGLISLIVLILLRFIVSIPIGTNASMEKELGDKIAVTLRDFGPFIMTMFFRKNGKTGWAAILSSEDINETSCIEENLKARRARDFDRESAVDDASIPPTTNVDEPPIANEQVSNEINIVPEDSPVISVVQNEEPVSELAPPFSADKDSLQTAEHALADMPEKDRIAKLEEENALLKQMYADLALRLSRKKE